MPMVRKDNSDMIYRTLPEKWDAVVDEIKELHDERPAGSGRHGFGRKLRADRRTAESDRRAAQCPERQISRARSRDHRAGRTQRRGHDRDQHGRPRHRHSARRQSRFLAREFLKRMEIDPDEATERAVRRAACKGESASSKRNTKKSSPSAACTSSAPNATNRGASTISFADVPDVRAIPGSSRFVLSLEDDLMRIFAGDKVRSMMEWLGMEKGVAIESKTVSQADRACAKSRRSPQLRNTQTPAQIRRRHEQAARDDLWPAPPVDVRTGAARVSARRKRRRAATCFTISPSNFSERRDHRPTIGTSRHYTAEIESIYALDPASGCGCRFQTDERRSRSKKRSGKRPRRTTTKRKSWPATKRCAPTSASSCSTSSTRSGRTICCRSTM